MNAWGDLIQRLTHRLEVDEELRLDVARELHGHLEDSASEFRAAGQSEAEAAASAAKALGDEGELAQQLWQANRPRIRLRGLLRWTARVTLLPAATVIVLVLLTYLVGVAGFFHVTRRGVSWARGRLPWPVGPVGAIVCDPYLGVRLTADQRWLLFGDPNARTALERAKSIADHWPDDPVCYANYVACELNRPWPVTRDEASNTIVVDEQRLAEVLAVLHRGQHVDPSNGIYDALIAELFIDTSTVVKEDPSTTYEAVPGRGKSRWVAVKQVEITDAARFAEGLEEFREALSKPLLRGRSLEMLSRRVAVLPSPVRMIQYVDRLRLSMETQLLSLWKLHSMSEVLLGYALDLARQGRRAEADQLLRHVERLAARLGAQAEALVETLIARSICDNVFGYEEVIAREGAQAARAEQAKEQRHDLWDLLERITKRRRDFDSQRERQMGLLEAHTGLGSLPGSRLDMKAVRVAELFVVGQIGLLALIAMLLLVAVVYAADALPSLVFAPRPERPVLLFVGWRRMGRIVLLAVVVPLMVFGAYGAAAAAADPDRGLFGVWNRLLAELALVCWVIVILVVRLSRVAIRQRAAELGMELPPRPPHAAPWRVAVLAAPVVGLVGYIVFWWASWGHTRPFDRHVLPGLGVLLAAAVPVMLACDWLLHHVRSARALSVGAGYSQATWQVPRVLRTTWRLAVAIIVMTAAIWVGDWAWEASIPRGAPVKNEPLHLALFTVFYAVLIFASGWLLVWALFPKPVQRRDSVADRRLGHTFSRSLVPVLAAAVIVVGVVLGGLLTVGEGYAISRMGGTVPFLDELTHSDWNLLREHFVELDKVLQAQETGRTNECRRFSLTVDAVLAGG